VRFLGDRREFSAVDRIEVRNRERLVGENVWIASAGWKSALQIP